MWNTLKTTSLYLQRPDLAVLCVNRDLEGERADVFDSSEAHETIRISKRIRVVHAMYITGPM